MHSISVRLLIAIGSAALSWVAYYYIAVWFEWENPIFLANVMLASIFLHEVGHWAAYQRHGIPSFMFFAVILGGVGPLNHHQEDRLHDNAKAEIVMAGVFGNIVCAIGALICWFFGWLTLTESLQVVNINAILIVFNLLPFGMLDGGQMAKILFDSVEERSDMVYVHHMSLVVIGAAFATVYLGDGHLFFALLFVVGFRRQANNDDPLGSLKPTALNHRQQCLWARTYVFLASGAMVATAITPDWLG